MGMTIDEAINHLGNYSSTNGSGLTTDKQHNEAKRVAIDTMRKYQKIKEIMDELNGNFCGNFLKDRQAIYKICEVIKDGNDNR